MRCLGSKKTFDRLLLGHYEKCCQIGYEQFLNLFHSPEIFHCSLLGCRHRMALFHHTLTNLKSLDLLARFGPYYHSIIDFIEVAKKKYLNLRFRSETGFQSCLLTVMN